MRLRTTHTTQYRYPAPVTESHNELRLMPLSDKDQTCLDFHLSVTPSVRTFAYDLPTGRVHQFNIRAPHRELVVKAESLVITNHHNPFAEILLHVEDSGFYLREGVRQRFFDYLAPTERVPLTTEVNRETDRIAALAKKQASVGNTGSFLIALTRLLHHAFVYAPGSTHVNTPLHHVLEHKQGVCQDFAHLMLAICRRQGIPARYVSGYLCTGARPDASTSEAWQETLDLSLVPQTPISGDAMHAWVECLLPTGQWKGFDPTNNLLTNDAYIKVHYGRDYGDVPPLRGMYHGPAGSLEVSVKVVAERN